MRCFTNDFDGAVFKECTWYLAQTLVTIVSM